MLLLYMLIIWASLGFPQHPFNMYYTDHQQQQHDTYCLLYYVLDNIVDPWEYSGLTHELVAYCLRSSVENILVRNSSLNKAVDSKLTFAELREKNITSEMLLSWSASIDLVEHYQIFLDNGSDWFSSKQEQLFYNCTSSWFGPFCRFAFDSAINLSFDRIIMNHFRSKLIVTNDSEVPCYKHLNCSTSIICLDWRDICDRKIDCLDGSDEIDCWEMEMNECASNEYRCHNGQCIPMEFLRDSPSNPDCLDQSDEYQPIPYSTHCSKDPSFRCEERACRPGRREFSCSDGECRVEKGSDCVNGRNNILRDNSCSRSMVCLTHSFYGQLNDLDQAWCNKYCADRNCAKDYCPSQYEFPFGPVLFGHVRFIYTNKDMSTTSDRIFLPDYICYDEERCREFLPATEYFNSSACRHFHELGLQATYLYPSLDILIQNVKDQFRACLIIVNETYYCNNSILYQCLNASKCISKHRLVDGFHDCPFGDDETFNESCSLNDYHHRFQCLVGDRIMCLASLITPNGIKDCTNGEDEQTEQKKSVEDLIHFPVICDGKTDLSFVLDDDRSITDEIDCEQWPCNNTYSRCDGYWLCKNGADEVNCSPSNCSELEHSCVYLNDTSKVSCLPFTRAGDGIIDCIGALDERKDCLFTDRNEFFYAFHCLNNFKCLDFTDLCDPTIDCRFGDNETFCDNYKYSFEEICDKSKLISRTAVENLLCYYLDVFTRPEVIYFKLYNMPIYSQQLTTYISSTQLDIQLIQSNLFINTEGVNKWQCHRGLPIRFRKNDDSDNTFCLCPPSYYGDRCQYQNQRVSLTFQVRVVSNWRSVLTFVVFLIDENGNLESHDHVEYLPIRDCDTKFNINLLYSIRPKNRSKNYFIRIDAFNQITLNYRASWIFSLQFPFLPVHRLSALLIVPVSDVEIVQQCTVPCIHGQCFAYVNNQSSVFCRCESGWSGKQCDREHRCSCAPGSLCLDDSICVCPLGRFGPHCYLRQSSCHSNSCVNHGQCAPTDERHTPAYMNQPSCICSEEYSGVRCEHRQTRIDISFGKELIIPPSLFIHLITVQNSNEHIRTSVMKKVPFDQDSLSLYTSSTFNFAFAEMFRNYYLIILREQPIVSAHLSTKIISSHRCVSIYDLFNDTLAHQHLLKRIKYYHIPCQERSNLICFYDSIQFCLCDLSRQVNCFKFDHNMTYDCRGYNFCENEGQCFQDHPKCPTSSFCVCRECYYGSRCHFSTKGWTLSLDAILGYQIHSNTELNRQRAVVKVAIALTTAMFTLGLISNIFSCATFRMTKTHNVGCGLYLFVASIISLIAMSVFIVKFWLLLASQMGSITNRSFMQVQCVLIDFLLRILLSTGDWLSACVAIERAVSVSKGANFDKAKSKQFTKWMIVIVFLFTICTSLHDPIHRHLINDEEEQRTWCITKYSLSLQIVDRTLNVLHFSMPFLINCISALIIIITATRSRSNVHKNQNYTQVLRQQFAHHKHLLISPFILVILAVPRLIISFLSGCMKSARDSWFYLIGYFISFIPMMSTFIVFVLPSEMYRKQFSDSLKRIWQH